MTLDSFEALCLYYKLVFAVIEHKVDFANK